MCLIALINTYNRIDVITGQPAGDYQTGQWGRGRRTRWRPPDARLPVPLAGPWVGEKLSPAAGGEGH